MLSGGDVAEERGAVEGGGGGTDGGGYVVVAGGDIGNDGAEDVEGGGAANLLLDFHIVLNLVEWYVAGTFDHNLAAFLLCSAGEFSEGPQFGELCLVGCVGDAAGTEAVTERKTDVVLGHYVTQVVEHFVEWVLAVMIKHPFCDKCPAATDDSGGAGFEEGQVLFEDAGVYCEEINALCGLLFDDIENCFSVYLLDGFTDYDLIDWYCSEGDGAFGEDFLAGVVEVSAGT